MVACGYFPPVHAAGGSAHPSSETQASGVAIFATITKGGKKSQEGFTPTIKLSDPEAEVTSAMFLTSHLTSKSHMGFWKWNPST